MPTYDFDFQRYVQRRKGQREAQVRQGAAYAFPGDVRLLRTLDRLRPVQLALEEAGRLWRSVARAEVLGTAVRAAGDRFPAVQQAALACARALHIDVPAVYVAPRPLQGGVLTLGEGDDAYIILPAGLLDTLSDRELLDVVGRQCGRIQNGHVPFLTALHYLTYKQGGFLRWIVRPATLTLSAWERRADITADRAGLICSRDLEASLAALGKLHSDDGDEAISRRGRALTRFAGSAYYLALTGEGGGESQETCDAAVTRILEGEEP